jgi:hypothetical protein
MKSCREAVASEAGFVVECEVTGHRGISPLACRIGSGIRRGVRAAPPHSEGDHDGVASEAGFVVECEVAGRMRTAPPCASHRARDLSWSARRTLCFLKIQPRRSHRIRSLSWSAGKRRPTFASNEGFVVECEGSGKMRTAPPCASHRARDLSWSARRLARGGMRACRCRIERGICRGVQDVLPQAIKAAQD